MESKGKYLITYVWLLVLLNLYSCKSVGQNDGTTVPNNFTSYNELMYKMFNYYADNISKGGKDFMVGVCVSKFDTAKKELKIILDFSWGNPIPYLNTPTHIITWNNRIYVIRFDKSIDQKLIKKFDFKPISKEDISYLKKTGDFYMKKNHTPTGYSQSLVVELKDNILKTRWYENAESAPREDRIIDFDWLKNQMPYEVHLKEKLKEYGY
jgi:hypothetical protein